MVFGHYLYVLWICIAVVLSGTYAEEQCAANSESFTVQLSPGDDIREKILKDPKIADYIKKAVKTNERLGHIKIHVGNQVEVQPNEPTNLVSTTISSDATLFQTTFPTATGTGTDTTAWTRTSVETISLETTKETSSNNHSRPESGSCYKILAKENIQTILERNVTQRNHTGNSNAGNYTITFSNSEEKKVDDIKYTIIKFCVSWDSFADATEIDLGEVLNHVKAILRQNDDFIGIMVPSDWDMWRFSPKHQPAWYKIYNESKKSYWEASKQCQRNNGLLAYYTIIKSNHSHWQQLLEKYDSAMSFWSGMRYYDSTIIGNGGSLSADLLHWKHDLDGEMCGEFIKIDQTAMLGTSGNGSTNYFICEAVSIRTHRFQILSSEKRSDEELLLSLVDSFNIDVTISDLQQIESDWDGIYIVKFQTKVARRHIEWPEHWDYLQQQFNGDTRFIGKPVPSAWKLWSSRSFPMWCKVYNHSGVYDKDKELCTRKGGDLPDARWIEYDWTEVIENYTDGVRFWTNISNTVSHVTLFPNGTRTEEDASHFLCASVPLSQYCFQVLTNATNAKNILQYLKVNKSLFSEEEYEEVKNYGNYNIFKYRIYTVYTEDHFWDHVKEFSQDYFQGKILGSPVPCDWDLSTHKAFAWYKKFTETVTHNEANQMCTKYNGRLADAIIHGSKDEWKIKLSSGHEYWIAATSEAACPYVKCYHSACSIEEWESCNETKMKAFVCESQLFVVNQRISMQVVVGGDDQNKSLLLENLWKIWSDQKYLVHIDALMGSGAFQTTDGHKIFKFNVFASGDGDNAVRRKLVAAFKNSSEADRALFQTNPAADDWSLWTKLPSALVWYKIFHDKKNYEDSREKCEKFGARLAAKTIRVTVDELQHWNSKLKQANEDVFWIGLEMLDGSFEWSDGATYDKDNTLWDNNQPDNAGVENCGQMWYKPHGRRLNNGNCKRQKKFICESD